MAHDPGGVSVADTENGRRGFAAGGDRAGDLAIRSQFREAL